MKAQRSSTFSLTSALDEGGWSKPRPGHFIPGKETRNSVYRRLSGSEVRSAQVRKISHPPGFDSRAVHLEATGYTD